MMLVPFSLTLIVTLGKQTAANLCKTVEASISGKALEGHTYKAAVVNDLIECQILCENSPLCRSYNFFIPKKICEMNNVTKEVRPENFVKDDQRFYMRVRDIDECKKVPFVCDVNAYCQNTDGSYHCFCKEGYAGNGHTCEDIDECSTAPSVCDINALCHNNLGSYECSCRAGFVGDGKTCSTSTDAESLNATSSCGFPSSLVRVTNSSGTIWSSGGWPYSHNMNCSWHLSGNALLELVFDSFRTHSSADYLVVYAGDSPNAPLVGQFSGTSLPAPINSSSGKLYMTFISDASGNDYGFRARYHVLKAGSIRLQGNETSTGRVEIFHDNKWGTICDSSWDINDANVVCRQLNSPHALRSFGGAFHGQGSGPIWMAGVSCRGNESRLYDCTHRGWGVSDCSHSRDASVKCSSIRLANGGPNYGRVEVLYKGIWGTVCDDDWGLNDAHAVCRQLGFTNASAAKQGAAYGEGSGPIWLDNVNCKGDEASIFHCVYPGWGIHNCVHREDASVICNK